MKGREGMGRGDFHLVTGEGGGDPDIQVTPARTPASGHQLSRVSINYGQQ